jgi:hypothetical protein
MQQIGTMWDLVQGGMDLMASERQRIIAWLRAHEDQHERAIAAGACIRGSTTHGELRDQAAYYSQIADALEVSADRAWEFGFSSEDSKWLKPFSDSGRLPKGRDTK